MNKGVKLGDIKMDPDLGGQAAVNLSGDLIFQYSDQINIDNLGHEWGHLFQKSFHDNPNNYVSISGDNQGMVEFERHFAEDVNILIECNGNLKDKEALYHKWAAFDSQNPKNPINKDPYIMWLLKITNNGKNYPSEINSQDFQIYGKRFG